MESIQNQPEPSSLMAEQVRNPHVHQPPNQRRFVFRMLAILLVAGGSIVWILNIVGVIPGPWSSIFGVIFAVIGVILGIFPPSSHETRVQPANSSVHQSSVQHNYHIQLEGVTFGIDDQYGALVVFVKSYLRGSTINLCRGFHSVDLMSERAAIVVGHRKFDHVLWLYRVLNFYPVVYAAVFSALEPGNYTVYSESREFIGRVTIPVGQVTVIDWQ